MNPDVALPIEDLSHVFNSLPGLHVVLLPDTPKFTVVAVSDAFLESTGADRGDVIGKGLLEAFPINPTEESQYKSAQEIRRSLRKVLSSKQTVSTPALKYAIKNPDTGAYEERYWSLQSKPLLDRAQDVAYIVHTALDITDEVTAAQHLKAAEERYQAFVKNSSEGISRFELEQPIPLELSPAQQVKRLFKHAYLAEANEAVADMYGANSVEELIGLKLSAFIVQDDPHNISYLRSFVESGYNLSGLESHEKDLHGNDKYFRNSLLGVVEDGGLVRLWGTQQDITEQVLSHNKYTNLIESITDAFFSVDQNWNFTYLNKHAEKLIKRPASDLIGKNLWEEFQDAKGSKFETYYKQVAATNKPASFEEYYPGSNTWYTVHAYPSPDGISVFFADITKRKQTETENKQSEERLALALKASGMGMWEWNIATNSLTWDTQLKKIYGLKASETVDYERFMSLIYPADRKPMLAIIKQAMQEGNTYSIEHRIRRTDGTVHWVQGQGQALYENDKPVRMIGTCVLIDSRKRAELALKQGQKELQARIKQQTVIGELGLTALGSHDIQNLLDATVSALKDALDIEFVNVYELQPETKNLLLIAGVGWDKNIVIGKYAVETKKNVPAAAALASNKPIVIKDMRKQKELAGSPLLTAHNVVSGMNCVIHGIDGPYGVLGAHTSEPREFTNDDIHYLQTVANLLAMAIARKQTEAALRESEERFRTLADTMPVLIWEADTEKKCTYFNKPWLVFTGRSIEQEQGNGWTESIHPDDRERYMEAFNKAFEAHKPFRVECRLRRHDDAYRLVLSHGTPRFSPQGSFLGYIGSCMDIEDLKRNKKRRAELEEINEKLKVQRSQLVALNSSKDEFISLASHQLRTPATGVKQYIGMLLEGYVGDLAPEQTDVLRTAYESNERQITIIDDLLRVAHVDAGKVILKKVKTNINALLQDVLNEQAEAFNQRKQTVTFLTTSTDIWARVDPDRLRMVLENMIDNASKYTQQRKNINVSMMDHGTHVAITIKDQGVGIAKADIPKLFHKFSRINNPLSTVVGGTGLGLYWAKKIIGLHGGEITVASKLNQGSTFTITLPKDNK